MTSTRRSIVTCLALNVANAPTPAAQAHALREQEAYLARIRPRPASVFSRFVEMLADASVEQSERDLQS